MVTILCVDDDEDILDLVEYTLLKDGYDVICAKTTKNIISILDEEKIDLIIMDRNLPGIEGSEFIAQIKQDGYNYPVIYLSAKDKNEDILEGFDRGADDYITKPFDINILKARVNAVLKRYNTKNDIEQIGSLSYDKTIKTFYLDKQIVKLTKLEHDLLLTFFKNNNKLLTRDFLIDEVWQGISTIQEKTVNVAVKRLKEKLNKTYISTIRGQGYILSI